jgi:phage-related protein
VSLEAIYTSILDDDFFIDLSKGFSSILDGIKSFIDGVGGIKTVFMGIGSMFLSAIAGKIGPALQ